MRPTMLYRVYTVLTRIALPLLAKSEQKKVLDQGFSAARAREKLGHASATRPNGTLIWLHAASVGESLSVLTLIDALSRQLPRAQFLITSGTGTSAEIVAKRLPERTQHQFAPLDATGPVKRFLDHWRPDAGIFVESELWPQTLWRAQAAGVRLALVNARLSDGSVRQWRKFPKTGRQILSVFRAVLAQNDAMHETLVSLGARADQMHPGVNLKSFATALPNNPDLVARLRSALGERPVWIAASTHAGEEQILLDAHAKLLKTHPDLTLILVPRHPDRRAEISAKIDAHGWQAPQLSAGQDPEGPVFLADTLGDLGSLYALSNIVFLGGSLLPIGGHNPFEPAMTGAAILSGRHVANFAETYDAMEQSKAVAFATTAEEIAARVDQYLSDATAHQAACDAAKAFCSDRSEALTATATVLIDRLELSDA